MTARKNTLSDQDREKLQAELRRDVAVKKQGYRERALKLFPHVCASCGREFSGRRLKELTVHHKDHDFRHNPPDGSNWELLCIYCHDHEHEKELDARHLATGPAASGSDAAPLANPFASLDQLFGGSSDKKSAHSD